MKTLLWIEDDYQRLRGLVRPLEKMGFKVDCVPDCPSFADKDKDIYDAFIVDLILPQKREGEFLGEDEYDELPGIRIVEDLDKLGKPIVVLTVVTDQRLRSHLEGFSNVKLMLNKGSLFPSDFKSEILGILGMTNGQQ